MHRKVPLQFLNVIINWYCSLNVFAYVRWNDTISSVFQLCGVVRQGGVLSSVFAVYMLMILLKTCSSRVSIVMLVIYILVASCMLMTSYYYLCH